MSAEPTVFIVDDDAAMLDSLRWLVESLGHQVKTFSSARSFLDSVPPDPHGCLIADIRMPDMSGLELQEELVKRRVLLPIIMITAFGDVPTTVRALKSGAMDFIEKPFSDQILLDRIDKALKRSAENQVVQARQTQVMERVESLTARECEVMELVVSGKANKVIARDLGVSTKTVEAHRAKVMQKMKADSVADLVKMALVWSGSSGA